MQRKEMPELKLFRKLVSYDRKTGIFLWKERPDSMFPAKRHAGMWNKRFSGKQAFCTKSHNGYLYGALFESNYSTHRLAWYYVYGEVPDEVDHINGDRTDNRIANLRDVSRKENCKNAKRRAKSLSGAVGVSWDPVNSKWHVRVGKKHIGRFRDFDEAVSARKAAQQELGYHKNHGR